MADLATTIAGALQQAGLHDPQMIASITQSVMGQLPQQQPGGPAWSGPSPSAQFGYEGQPDRDLLASQSFGRGPAPAAIDPRAAGDIQAGIAAEQGWQPFVPPVDRADARSGLPFVTPQPKSLLKSKGKPKGPALSDADRLNWQQVAAHGGQVPAAIRSLLASGA